MSEIESKLLEFVRTNGLKDIFFTGFLGNENVCFSEFDDGLKMIGNVETFKHKILNQMLKNSDENNY